MYLGQSVSSLYAFPGVSSLCSFGCSSGFVGAFDAEKSAVTVSQQHTKKIVALAASDSDCLYFADSQRVFRKDIRSKDDAQLIMQTISQISDIAVYDTSILAATERNGLTLTDGRNIQRMLADEQVNPVAPCTVCFSDNRTVLAGYGDSHVVRWDFLTEANVDLNIPGFLTARKLQPMSIVSFGTKTVVGYESGFSIYEEDQFKEHSTFDQKGRFTAFTEAACFGKEYIVALVGDNVLLPCSLTEEAVQPMELHGSEVRYLSANAFMLFTVDGDDEGYIAALMPEAFGDQFY